MKPELNIPNSTVNAHTASAAVKPNGGSSNVTREFHNFLADIEDLIKATTSLTGEDLARATAKLSERVATAKESIEDMGDTIVLKARKTAASTSSYVHANPWKAIGAGAALAFLLGFVVSRRS
jgi:ElaB/YqjD/DUF883 family membrane-anchored ribosome-binding protein